MDHKTPIWASGLISFVVIFSIVLFVSKVLKIFLISDGHYLIVGLLLWLILIHWFRAFELDLEHKHSNLVNIK